MSLTSNSSSSSSSPSPPSNDDKNIDAFLDLSIYALSGLELTLNVLIVPISFVNFIVIFQTAVVHPNLKFVLLVQSALILAVALTRAIIDTTRFVEHNPYTQDPMLVTPLLVFSMQFLDFLGHVLFAERVAATVWARWYERAPANWTLNAAWFIVLFIVSAVYCWAQICTTLTSTSVLNLGVNYALMALSLCEWVGLAAIELHNRNRYNWFALNENKAEKMSTSLSERYQLAENVRTGRQLALCFAMHFVDTAAVSVLVSALFFFPPKADFRILTAIIAPLNTIYTAADLVILVSIILYHPVLRRNAFRLWRNLRAFLGLNPGRQIGIGNPSFELRSLNGRPLAMDNDVGGLKHFTALRAQWNC